MVSMVGFEPTPLSGYCGFRDRCVSHFTTSKYLETSALIPLDNRELYWRRGRDSNSQSLSARRFSRARLLPTKVPRHLMVILRSINRASNPWYCQSGIVFAIISELAGQGRLELPHRLLDYSRFSKPLPYQIRLIAP